MGLTPTDVERDLRSNADARDRGCGQIPSAHRFVINRDLQRAQPKIGIAMRFGPAVRQTARVSPGGSYLSRCPANIVGTCRGRYGELRLANLPTAVRLRLAEIGPVVLIRNPRTNIAQAAILRWRLLRLDWQANRR